MNEVHVQGLTELKDLLERKLPEAIRKKALQRGLTLAAKVIVADAKRRAPVKTGRLEKAIYSYRARSSTRERQVRFIGVRSGRRAGKRDAYYWRWLEFGRSEVKAKKKKVLGTPATGFMGKSVRAVPARPFLRPAFEAKKLEALEVFRRDMALEIDKIGAKYGQSLERKIRRSAIGL